MNLYSCYEFAWCFMHTSLSTIVSQLFYFIYSKLMCSQDFIPLAWLELRQKFAVVVGGGVESNFSVHLWSKSKFCSWAWTWTKLNNILCMGMILTKTNVWYHITMVHVTSNYTILNLVAQMIKKFHLAVSSYTNLHNIATFNIK